MKKKFYECPAYACYLKDQDELKKSTSGGVFFALALWTIENGGMVYGASYAEDTWAVEHIRVSDKEGLKKLRRSKYVQSRIGDCYIHAKEDLEGGLKVLFSGTPCQIAGLKSFLGNDYDNLLTVEVICHGVPSGKIFQKHMEEMECNNQVQQVIFRDKSQRGWNGPYMGYVRGGATQYVEPEEDPYCFAFNHAFLQRPSCARCRFNIMNSSADLQVGDYWGIQGKHPDFINRMGVSAVILKTDKGEKVFNQISDQLEYIDSDVRKVVSYNGWLVRQKGRILGRDIFFREYKKGIYSLKELVERVKEELPKLRVGLIGSYNLRPIYRELALYDQYIDMAYHITGTNVVSLMGDASGQVCDAADGLVSKGNAYRFQVVKDELSKTGRDAIRITDFDYVIVDLLEERYPWLKIDGSVYTVSEAFEDYRNDLSSLCDRGDIVSAVEASFDEWKASCDEFAEFLISRVAADQIVLLEMYLTGRIRNTDDTMGEFSEAKWIGEINARLALMYRYFAEKTGCHVVSLDGLDETDYCMSNFEFGCKPEHFNYYRYIGVARRIIDYLEERDV